MNDNFKFGEKVKKRRKALGLTQSDVCEGFMTRNMLSLIEKGTASPSLETAERIAYALKLPLGYLLSEADDLFLFEKCEKISYIKELCRRGNYKHCMTVLDSIEGDDDETAYIYAYAAFSEGKRLILDGSLLEGERLLGICLEKSKLTIYDTSFIEANVKLYHAVASNIGSPLLELDCDRYEKFYTGGEDYEFYKYISMDRNFDFKNQVFAKHLEAKLLIKRYSFAEALAILLELLDKSKYPYNSYVVFGIYSDLENIYKQQGDFENAYRYSAKRMSLINAFNK